MRYIYLIRHGRPEFPNGKECCIGLTDYPLSKEGLHQAERLGEYFSEIPISAVYCSTLTRSMQTAEAIARKGVPVITKKDLHEIDCGTWEGLTFAEIKEKYPELYEKRGLNPTRVIPEGGESLEDGLLRFESVVEQILNESTGNIVIVAHASVNRLFLCMLMLKSLQLIYTIPQPYGCINEIQMEPDQTHVSRIGFMPDEFPDEETIRYLWERYNTPRNVIMHCQAVANKAVQMTKALAERGYKLDERLVNSAALLHDIERAETDHALKGAQRIAKEGYEKVASVVAAHHNLNESAADPVTAKTIVFLADKLISGDREVLLEERFAESTAKCGTEEAMDAHKRKYDQAAAALLRVNSLIGKENL